MVTRINVPLSEAELTALVSMSDMDCRHPKEEILFLLRVEAQRRGLLVDAEQPTTQGIPDNHEVENS